MKNRMHTAVDCPDDCLRESPAVEISGNFLPLRTAGGFSLVELIVIMVIVGILVVIAIPTYATMKQKAQNSACLGEIRTLDKEIIAYEVDMGMPPDSLNDIGRAGVKDPWGNPYQYQKLAGGLGVPYEDPIGDPLNTDYDLFSKGVDQSSTMSLTGGNPSTDDDIIRGDDGLYLGLGEDYF